MLPWHTDLLQFQGAQPDDMQVNNNFNADELIGSIQQKLWIWRWRDLTIIRRIKIVKTFIVPIFLYHAGWIPENKEFVKETNKIVFEFIWKGKDKVKCFAFISDMKMGD